MSFASARQRAVEELDPRVASVLSSPNDTLAVEYIRAIDTLKSELAPFAVRREGVGHDSGEAVNSFASASLIRTRVRAGENFDDLMPESAAAILRAEIEAGRAPADINALEKAVLACLRISTPEKIAAVPDISEGLENRIYSASRSASSLEELYSLTKTKRYSHARIRRVIAALLLGIEAPDCEGIPPYIRVLGFNAIGREKLRAMRSSAKLPIVMRAADIKKLGERAKRISSIEERAADLFSLALPSIMPCGAEYTDEISVI